MSLNENANTVCMLEHSQTKDKFKKTQVRFWEDLI